MKPRLRSKILSCVLSSLTVFPMVNTVSAMKPTKRIKLSKFRSLCEAKNPRLPSISSSSLHRAVEHNNLNEVKILVRSGVVEIDSVNGEGMTPLHVAADKGYLPIVRYLVQEGANINARNLKEYDWTPILYAASADHTDVIEYLASLKGIEINAADSDEGFTALTMACTKNNLRAVKCLLGHGADLYMRSEDDDYNALEAATFNGSMDVVHYLIDELHVSYDATSLLKIALILNKVDTIPYYIQHGADVSQVPTILHKAIIADKSVGFIQYLIDFGAKVASKDEQNRTPLHLAAYYGSNIDVVSRLVEASPMSVYLKDNDGKTPLDLAIEQHHSKIIEALGYGREIDFSSPFYRYYSEDGFVLH